MVKHIALRSKSVANSANNYTTPGLGDRAHHVLFAYQYSVAHDIDVILHLTSDKYGKQHKKESWAELCDMVHNKVSVKPWPKCGLNEDMWLSYLAGEGISADLYWYSDTFGMNPYEQKIGIDAAKYLKKSPELIPIVNDLELPEKYITVQWDSTDKSRSFTSDHIQRIEQVYSDQGFDIITIGGQAEGRLKTSLKYIGAAIYGARYHVGSESGMMHLAQYYKKYEDIYVHNNGYKSHHFYRMKKNGGKINQ